MAKFINVAHSEHSPNTGGGTPTAPRASGARPDNYSRFHLSGFSFYHGEPMHTHLAVHDFLLKPAFMPWRKTRGEVDSYLRFETTLRVLFEAVIFFEEFWGRRGFWAKIRNLLKLDHTVSADTLEDTVKLYCEGRRHCLAKVPKPGKPPNKIAELAEIVDRFRPGEHAPIPKVDWGRREDKWRGKLYYVLTSQGVHSQQVQDGSCHPVLLDPLPSPLSASPRSETQRRDRFEPRPRSPARRLSSPSRRQPSPPRRSSLDQPRRPRENEPPQEPKVVLPPKPPAPARSKEPILTEKEKATTPTAPAAHRRELPAKSTVATISQEPTQSVQSLDELVDTYKNPSGPAENLRKRSRDELPEGADTANKRLATEPIGNSPRSSHPIVPPIETQQPLDENTRSRFEPTIPEATPAQEPQRIEKVASIEEKDEMILDAIEVAGIPEKLSSQPLTPVHKSVQNDDTATVKVADRVRSPDAMSDSLFVEKTDFLAEDEEEGAAEPIDAIRDLLLCLEQRQVRLEALEASADSQKKMMETWAADRKRIAELEAQLSERAPDARWLQTLQHESKAHSEQLAQQSSVNQHVEERLEATACEVREVKTVMGHHISDGARERIEDASIASKATAQVREELWHKCETDGELFRQTNRAVEEAKKQIADAESQTGLRFAEIEKRSEEVQRKFSDVENRLRHQLEQHDGVCKNQWDWHSSACQVQRAGSDDSTETRLAELQRQLGQVQEALHVREAMDRAAQPPPSAPVITSSNVALSNGLDPGSLSSLDTGTFLDTMYYEMSKLRTAMRTRIRAMDIEGVPDEDDSKLAVSDISYELGRVLDVARKRINKL